jgi:prepilin-type N-terminal cleavage/methylation domain-containing protein
MKTPKQRRGSLPLWAVVGGCLRWLRKPRATTGNGTLSPQRLSTARRAQGFTLIEVLAAAAIISIGMTAMVSLSATLMLQEELANRVSISRNYQENTVRLWQLGLSTVQITALMPSLAQNALLQQALYANPVLVENGLTTVNGVVMETLLCTAVVNSSQTPSVKAVGASFTLTAYRPHLVTTLRAAP